MAGSRSGDEDYFQEGYYFASMKYVNTSGKYVDNRYVITIYENIF